MPTVRKRLLQLGPFAQTVTLTVVGALVVFLAIGGLFGALYPICSEACSANVPGVYLSSATIIGGLTLIQLGIFLHIRTGRRSKTKL